MSLVIDKEGLVHEVFDTFGTICGKFHPTMGTAEAGEVVTCFACMHPSLSRECGHLDAEIQNCPYAMEIRDDREQRCKCCSRCSHECAMDV